MHASTSLGSHWQIIGKSVRGASHLRSGLPNQDAIGWIPNATSSPIVILAIADGHGSARYFRSDVGAVFAVQAALAECEGLVAGRVSEENARTVQREAEEFLPQFIVQHWQGLVTRHLSRNPITSEEFDTLEKAKGAAQRQSAESNPLLCYGATVVAVLVTDSYVLYLQIGDGDILSISDQGEVVRPLKGDARLIANETTSLCLPTAPRDFRLRLQSLSEFQPAVLMLSTDGYANSFVDENAFFKAGSDFLALIKGKGLNVVNENLEGWLTDTSKSGSGDDITVGLVSRLNSRP